MKTLNRALLACLASLSLIGCATSVHLPSSTRQMPITGGEFLKGRIGFDISSSVPVEIINDNDATPPTRTSITVGEKTEDFGFITHAFTGSGFDVGLGLLNRIDFYYTSVPGIRLQLLGDAKSKGVKATLFAGLLGAGGAVTSSTAKAEVTLKGQELGLSIGKQNGKALVYITLASRGGDADIKLTQSSGTTYKYTDNYDHYIASLGVNISNDGWYFRGELSGNQIEWRAKSSATSEEIKDSGFEGGLTLGLGYIW